MNTIPTTDLDSLNSELLLADLTFVEDSTLEFVGGGIAITNIS